MWMKLQILVKKMKKIDNIQNMSLVPCDKEKEHIYKY